MPGFVQVGVISQLTFAEIAELRSAMCGENSVIADSTRLAPRIIETRLPRRSM